MPDLPSADQLTRQVRSIRREHDRALEVWDDIVDEAYGPRRSGEPVPGASGDADPTAASSQWQRKLQAALADVAAGTEHHLATLRRANRLFHATWQRHGFGRPPTGPPTIDEAEHRELLRRRRGDRGER